MPKIDESGVYRKCRGCQCRRPLREFKGCQDPGYCRVCQPPVELKPCAACGLMKPLTEFHVERTARDGRRKECKSCRNYMKRVDWADQQASKTESGAAAGSRPLDEFLRRAWR